MRYVNQRCAIENRFKYRMFIALFVLSLALNVLFFGCTETTKESGGRLSLLKKDVTDLNGDGIYDFATYVFLPIEYSSATVQKIVLVNPVWNVSQIRVNVSEQDGNIVTRYHIDNVTVFDSLEKHLDAFDKLRSNEETIRGEAQCKQYLGLGREDLPCVDIHSCSVACQGAPICHQLYMGVGEPFIHDLLDLQNGFNKMDQEIAHLRYLIGAMRNSSTNIRKTYVEDFLETIERVSYLSNEINNNPIINPNVYYICNSIDYNINELQMMANEFTGNLIIETTGGEISMRRERPDHSYVAYKVILLINFKTKGAYENLLVYDDLPKTISVWDLVVDSNFTTIENDTVIWNIKKVGTGDVQSYAVYSFKSNVILNESGLVEGMSAPYVATTTLALTESSYLKPFLSVFNSLFNTFRPHTNYYVALSITIFIFIVLLKVLFLLLQLIWYLILGLLSRNCLLYTSPSPRD